MYLNILKKLTKAKRLKLKPSRAQSQPATRQQPQYEQKIIGAMRETMLMSKKVQGPGDFLSTVENNVTKWH